MLLTLAAGIGAGVFFGESLLWLEPVGEAFIGLLQMAVWPYIVFSLIGGLGRLSVPEAARLGRHGGALLALFWTIGLAAVGAFALTFPSWTSATFFTASLANPGEPFDFVSLYVPSNPFASLAASVLPASVVFSVALGLSILPMPVERKAPLLDLVDTVTEALMSIASFVVKLAPVGVFALVGVTAGTMRLDELVRLQVYLYTYVALTMLLGLWVVPGLVTVFLPVSYRQVVRASQEALVTAFATGSLLVALPLVVESARRLLGEIEALGGDAGTESAVAVAVPVNFTLPNLGKLIALAFVPFAGWLTGFEVSVDQYPLLLATGLFSMFAEVVALPFLLDLMRIPADSLQLFVTLDVSTGRFGQMLGGAHTYALAVLVAAGAAGALHFQRPAMLRYGLVTLGLTLAVVGGLRGVYEQVLPHEYVADERFRGMQLAATPVPFRVRTRAPEPRRDPTRTRLAEIRARGVLRVGFLPDSLPHAFYNAESELVGLDVDLASVLAREMGVELEFVELSPGEMAAYLDDGRCDLAMSGLTVVPGRMLAMRFSEPYMKATVSFVVRDHDRRSFSSRDAVQALSNPRIAAPPVPYYVETLRAYLPRAQILQLNTPQSFFDAEEGAFDALFISAERGSAWTLIHPQFSVAVPQPDVLAAPVAIAMARDAEQLSSFVDGWLRLKQEDDTLRQLYDYWILGAGAQPHEPRWSVARDVLGWID